MLKLFYFIYLAHVAGQFIHANQHKEQHWHRLEKGIFNILIFQINKILIRLETCIICEYLENGLHPCFCLDDLDGNVRPLRWH